MLDIKNISILTSVTPQKSVGFKLLLVKTFILLLFLSVIVGQKLHAQNCNFNITSSNFVGEVQNNEQVVSYEFQLRRGRNSNNCRNFRAYFGKGNANSYSRKVFNGSKTVNYNLYQDSGVNNILKDFGDANTGEYLEGNLLNRNTDYTFRVYIKIPNLDSVFSNGPGYYNDLIPINFYGVKNNGSVIYQKSAYVNIQIIIPRFAELSVGPIGASHDPSSTQYTLDFGSIQNNESLQASLNVKGNVGFGIYMSSMNGGKLINNNSFINYLVKVGNSNQINLSNPGQSYYMTQRNNGTPQSAESFPVTVQLQTLSPNAESGKYVDVITITVNAW
mgnify:CR=1 FL=1